MFLRYGDNRHPLRYIRRALFREGFTSLYLGQNRQQEEETLGHDYDLR